MSDVATTTELEALKKDAGIPHLPTQLTFEARLAINGEGPRAYDWSDKPHRIVYDLCREIEKNAAERDRLRGALEGLLTLVEHANFEEGWCCCGDDMLHHQSPMDCGHTPVDMGEYHASLAIKEARAALKGDSQ